jgi:hypothetical protein
VRRFSPFEAFSERHPPFAENAMLRSPDVVAMVAADARRREADVRHLEC